MTEMMVAFVYQILEAAAFIVVPPLLASIIIGLVVAILQTATHINDQSFPQIVKLVVISFILFVSGATLSVPFISAAEVAFSFANLIPGK